MNINPFHPGFSLNRDLERLKRFKWVRMPYLLSQEQGNTDFNRVRSVYDPIVNALKVMFVCTHQLWGEGQGFNFEQMSVNEWLRFRNGYVDHLRKLAQIYAGRGIIYQIMNEQDSTEPRASVIVPPVQYGLIFEAAYATIKAVDPTARVITGGYNSGAGRGVQQFKSANIRHCDGVAFHPYGESANGDFGPHGHINAEITGYAALGYPLYITEWGVLGQQGAGLSRVTNYAAAMKKAFKGRILGDSWYAWLEGMDSGAYGGYGVVDRIGNVKEPLYQALIDQGDSGGGGGTAPSPSGGYPVVLPAGVVLNIRKDHTTDSGIIGKLRHNDVILPQLETIHAGGYKWRKIEYQGAAGWVATNAVRGGVKIAL